MIKLKVAFVCVHNSCRSQMAEALGKLLASDTFDSYSAGTQVKPQINQDGVRIIKDLYGIDMNETQRSKLLSDIPEVDIVVTMGCNVNCPNLPCKHREDWGLEDPSGKEDSEFIQTAKMIEEKVLNLKKRIQEGVIITKEINRVVEKNKKDWDSYSAKYLKYNHSDKILKPILNDPTVAFEKTVWSQIQKNVGDLKGKKICVPSSGDNQAVFAFALMGAQVTSCDISINQLATSKEVAKRIGLIDSIDFVCTDTMTLVGVQTGNYDFVYTSNGVHVWINDLESMYQSIYRILKQDGVYIMFDIHPFQRPFGDDMKVIKPYDSTGPFEDEYSINFHWRMQDLINAMISSGIQIIDMKEFQDEKNYDQPFWISCEDIVNGVTAGKEEVDRMYNWKHNPGIAIPTWLSIVGKK